MFDKSKIAVPDFVCTVIFHFFEFSSHLASNLHLFISWACESPWEIFLLHFSTLSCQDFGMEWNGMTTLIFLHTETFRTHSTQLSLSRTSNLSSSNLHTDERDLLYSGILNATRMRMRAIRLERRKKRRSKRLNCPGTSEKSCKFVSLEWFSIDTKRNIGKVWQDSRMPGIFISD